MPIKRKRNTTITKLRDTITTGRTNSITETWVGPYDLLKTKQASVASEAASTTLSPGEADTGTLTITYETAPPSPSSNPTTPPPIIEVEWVELRKKLEEHPYFDSVSDADRRKIAAALNNPDVSPNISGLAIDLYTRLLRGQTEYSIAVPVVRRTTHSPTSLSSGGAWFRSSPPVSISGWQFLKTADSVTRQGTSYVRREEWTGAKEWDPDIYP